MTKINKSFLREIIGNDSYDNLRGKAKLYVPIYIVVTGLVFILTRICFLGWLSTIFSLLTGWSLFSILFIIYVILLCNIECNCEEKIYFDPSSCYTWKEDYINSRSYKLTTVWFIVLLTIGITFGVISNREKAHYKFQCTTYLVDHQNRIYHIIENDDCEDRAYYDSLVEMKGHEIERQTDYQLCTSCEEWYEEVISDMEAQEHYRR